MKIEDINKRNIYKVPDDYFDELPGKIQKKIQTHNASTFEWTFWLKLSAPIVAGLLVLAFFIFRSQDIPTNRLSSLEMLNEVSSEELVSYLELTDVSSEEILNELETMTIEELEIADEEMIVDEEITEEELDALIKEYEKDV